MQYETKALHTEVLDWFLLDVARVVAINQYFETKIKRMESGRREIIYTQIRRKLTFESRKAIASKTLKIRLCAREMRERGLSDDTYIHIKSYMSQRLLFLKIEFFISELFAAVVSISHFWRTTTSQLMRVKSTVFH